MNSNLQPSEGIFDLYFDSASQFQLLFHELSTLYVRYHWTTLSTVNNKICHQRQKNKIKTRKKLKITFISFIELPIPTPVGYRFIRKVLKVDWILYHRTERQGRISHHFGSYWIRNVKRKLRSREKVWEKNENCIFCKLKFNFVKTIWI